MEQTTQIELTASFEITGWDETPFEPREGGAAMASATVRKQFSGRLEATSVAQLLTAGGEDGRGYVASERVEGTLDGRRGSFVLQHGGVGDATEQHAFGHVVPGTGTGELAGLRGSAAYAHDEDGARVTLAVTL